MNVKLWRSYAMIYIINKDNNAHAAGDISSLLKILKTSITSIVDKDYLESVSDNIDDLILTNSQDLANNLKLPENVKVISDDEWKEKKYVARIVDGEIIFGEPEQHDNEKNEEKIRNERNTRLRLCDKMSPMRWNTLSDVDKQKWNDYRQALLDIPQQEGFPWGGDINKAPWPKLDI